MEVLLLLAVLACLLVTGGTMVWMMLQMWGGTGGEPPRDDGSR